MDVGAANSASFNFYEDFVISWLGDGKFHYFNPLSRLKHCDLRHPAMRRGSVAALHLQKHASHNAFYIIAIYIQLSTPSLYSGIRIFIVSGLDCAPLNSKALRHVKQCGRNPT
jgi:hypothetical protein